MATIGSFLSCEEWGPNDLVDQARQAEQAGFAGLWISDHYHPWTAEQGQSPFVWSVIGALSQVVSIPVTTAVTCPTVRIHPAVLAQAAATSGVQHHGRFRLGVGSGEALNEHILGDHWPPADTRLEMLEEAVEVIRLLFEGGVKDHRGRHYTVENAQLFTRPDTPVPIHVSGFGPAAATLAGRIGDGYISTMPDADLVQAFRDAGGSGKPAQAGTKVCWGPDEDEARRTAHRLWATEQLPGQLAQELPTPRHFEQAATLVTPDMVGDAVVCGNDAGRHIAMIEGYLDAGYDEVYISQIGPQQKGFFDFYHDKVLPRFS
ncbi:MAG TPA: LLM class F420-dependent oxidoreductase [Mycobacteriales bacterium]|jgi:G6PDH family F420-dependent oxidoreductase